MKWFLPADDRPFNPLGCPSATAGLSRRSSKWFGLVGDGQNYSPLGIDCEDAATLIGHRSGWNRTHAASCDEQTVQEIAETNRAFRALLDQQPPPQRLRRLEPRRWKGRLA
ncbi:hypothetical protein ACIBTZ_33330 [Micromonospora sp. NPDC049460]|uniref:hypothetical protein n=1 Tax=Micromonospora sp. NPDC049460 TaxID=3364272 RepID=UPI0037BDC29E